MTIRELAQAVHENAVAHGWWDGKRSLYEIVALIHSEWSEALEEARAGRPLVWYACNVEYNPCIPRLDCLNAGKESECPSRGKKPEGIAVELIDGCIRILDLFGHYGIEMKNKDGNPSTMESLWNNAALMDDVPDNIANTIALLHACTSQFILGEEHDFSYLVDAMSIALSWVHAQGIDPLALLLEKHEYNKSRPYKHGKIF